MALKNHKLFQRDNDDNEVIVGGGQPPHGADGHLDDNEGMDDCEPESYEDNNNQVPGNSVDDSMDAEDLGAVVDL